MDKKAEYISVLKNYLPFYDKLTEKEKTIIQENTSFLHARKGEVIHKGGNDCLGFVIVKTGQFRAYMMSEEGKEITVYRLFERDMCLLAATCIFRNIDFDIWMEAREDSEYWVIRPEAYQKLMDTSIAVMKYTNELMSARFSDVMWTMEQILNKSVDKRLAAFLMEESENAGTDEIVLTHEQAARELGTAREVVSRMLKYFQQEGIVSVSRGKVKIIDKNSLYELARESLR